MKTHTPVCNGPPPSARGGTKKPTNANIIMIMKTALLALLFAAMAVAPPPPPCPECVDGMLCIDTCAYANDGACQDGGDGSVEAFCDYGTDCADCGPRG